MKKAQTIQFSIDESEIKEAIRHYLSEKNGIDTRLINTKDILLSSRVDDAGYTYNFTANLTIKTIE